MELVKGTATLWGEYRPAAFTATPEAWLFWRKALRRAKLLHSALSVKIKRGGLPERRAPEETTRGHLKLPLEWNNQLFWKLRFFGTAMTSSKDMKAGSVLQSSGDERRRAPLDQLPPPANSNKPLTPFSIEDILNKPSVKKSVASVCPPRVLEKVTGTNSARNGITTPSSPLCALEELASKTFKGLEVSVIQAAEGIVLYLQQSGFRQIEQL